MGVHEDFNQRLGVENIISTGRHGRIYLDPYDPYTVTPLPNHDCEKVIIKSHPDNTGIFNVGIADNLTPLNGYPLSPGDYVELNIGFSEEIGVCGELPSIPSSEYTGLTGLYTGTICWYTEMK